MLEINWSDVVSIFQQMQEYLVAIGVIIVLAIIAAIACRKMAAHKKYMVRTQAFVAAVLAVTVVLNLICTGPMYTLLSLASGNGSISDETSAKAEDVGQEIAEEGIVLLKNEDALLPLTGSTNINVFGWASTAPCYGGTGSGALNDAYHVVDLLEGLQNAGFNTNTELSDFYEAYRAERPTVGMLEQDWTLLEPPVSTYTQEMLDNAKAFSDTAMIVLTRTGGEHIDLPQDVTTVNYTNNSDEYEDFPAGTHYLEPSQTELDLIEMVCENFDNVILVYNAANTMELGIADEYAQIKSVLWVPGTGQNGFNALGEILNGTVNPSAKTADTFLYDLTASPSYNNFGNFKYENMDEYSAPISNPYVSGALVSFVNYTDSIYVGYKFYETAYAEAEAGNMVYDYDTVVQYPFGSGLSYTTFAQEMGDLTVSGGEISFDVTVTNTGDVAGKDVVEVYYDPPYTNGGTEKAAANLISFEKTKFLQPGESQTITVAFSTEDMASYDTYGEGAYVLEAGDYTISINQNAHIHTDSRVYTVDSAITYDENNARSTDVTAASNQFDFAEGEITYLSRADGFANFAEATAAPTSYDMPEADKAVFTNNSNYEPEADPDVEMPTTGADNGLTLSDLRGAVYDDERWESLLDELTISDMVDLVALGGYQTAAADSVGKVATTDCDGPASINNNFTGVGSIGFPAAVMIANTWNTDLALAFA